MTFISDTPEVETVRDATIGSMLTVEHVSCRYGRRGIFARRSGGASLAVDDVSLAVQPGETLALVGESGSGKSTLARAIAGLLPVASGRIAFCGIDLTVPVERRAAELRRRIQIIFQNPDASLNHRHRIGRILERPLQLFFGMSRDQRRSEVQSLLAAVQLPGDYVSRFPSEISGGERQRVAIARALAARPSLLICDEIISALDVSVQAAVLDLLGSIQQKTHLSLLFITHDLAVVRWFADRVAVLYRGHVCEVASVEQLFMPPFHPYTAVLLDAMPKFGRKITGAEAMPARAVAEQVSSRGCAFAGQCRYAIDNLCNERVPPWRDVGKNHAIRCHLPSADLARIKVEARHIPAPQDAARAGQIDRRAASESR